MVSGATFKAGTYALSEMQAVWLRCERVGVHGTGTQTTEYRAGGWASAVCTITNNDKPGTIVIIKKQSRRRAALVHNHGHWLRRVHVDGYTAGEATKRRRANLSAGTYTVKELMQLGWILTGIGGSTDTEDAIRLHGHGRGNGSTGVGDLNTQTATIPLKNGDTVTCMFENTGTGPHVTQGFWATHPR